MSSSSPSSHLIFLNIIPITILTILTVLRNPNNDLLWLQAVKIEAGAGLGDIAKAVLARALQVLTQKEN